MSERYKVIEHSVSGHCCFEATVIDTLNGNDEMICESFDIDDAKMIANKLNEEVRG